TRAGATIDVAENDRLWPSLIYQKFSKTAGDVVGEIHKGGPAKARDSCINNVTAPLRGIFRLVECRRCGDINESTPGVRSRRDSVDNYVFLCPERCGWRRLGPVDSEKSASTDRNQTIRSVAQGVDVAISRRA